MNDSRPVALKLSPIGVALLRIFSTTRLGGLLGNRRERRPFGRFHFFARFPAVVHFNWRDDLRVVPNLGTGRSPSLHFLEFSIARATRARSVLRSASSPANQKPRATSRSGSAKYRSAKKS